MLYVYLQRIQGKSMILVQHLETYILHLWCVWDRSFGDGHGSLDMLFWQVGHLQLLALVRLQLERNSNHFRFCGLYIQRLPQLSSHKAQAAKPVFRNFWLLAHHLDPNGLCGHVCDCRHNEDSANAQAKLGVMLCILWVS